MTQSDLHEISNISTHTATSTQPPYSKRRDLTEHLRTRRSFAINPSEPPGITVKSKVT